MGRLCLTGLLLLVITVSRSQDKTYTTANAHAHNDYRNPLPFWDAWKNGFGSVEADVFLVGDQLIVAHDSLERQLGRTLDSLYLQPLAQCIRSNKGRVYADSNRSLQLMIDIKSEAEPALQALIRTVSRFPLLTSTGSLVITISGNRPHPSRYAAYPPWIRFDGELGVDYTAPELERIPMLSGNFRNYSAWNGKGKMVEKEKAALKGLIEAAHRHHKKIRFWNAPDNLNSWYGLLQAGVDYLNTDQVESMGAYFRTLPDRQYTHPQPHAVYLPRWRNDGTNKPVKNIILLIGDGTGLAQWYAAYTANRGALNVFNMRHTGLSKTASYDSYITDSAPGATAFSAGEKTNNRAVGTDHTGNRLLLLPEILSAKKKQSAIITSGDARDATPAAFYAHQPERNHFDAIFRDYTGQPVDLLIGAMSLKAADSLLLQQHPVSWQSSIDSIASGVMLPLLVTDARAALPVTGGRGNWSVKALQKATGLLSENSAGFFVMLEGAQVDHGGHANRLPYLVAELLDLDRVVGAAMQFADHNGETLVIVTGDHETGGLTLTDGDFSRGYVAGQFSTDDHTAIPVPVFAYGPGSQLFDGVYENTAIFRKILQVLGIRQP